MKKLDIRHSYIRLNNSLTHLVQYGCEEDFVNLNRDRSSLESLEVTKERQKNNKNSSGSSSLRKEKPKSTKVAKQLLVFVPGNPGILGVYHDFLVKLYQSISRPTGRSPSTVIIGLGHNDFDHPYYCNYEPSDKICIENSELNFVEKSLIRDHKPWDVDLQVLNKVIILKRLVGLDPEHCRVVFIGHSIGCYIILRLLQDRCISTAHAGSILIHPALENLALTRKGAKIARYFTFKLDLVLRFAAYMSEFILPKSLRLRLTRWSCSPEFVRYSSEIVIESIAQLGCSLSAKALVEMAKSEFESVRDIDHKTLVEPHVNKLRLIYTEGDAWVNAEIKADLRRFYPDLRIDEQSTIHAFMMSPEVMENYAVKVAIMVHDCFEVSPAAAVSTTI